MTDRKATSNSWWRNLTPSRPFAFIFGAYLLGLLYYAAFRLLFYISFADQADHAPAGDILYAFLIGVRFDQIIVLSILLLPILILPWVSLRSKAVRTVALLYITIPVSFSFLLHLGDIPFYAFIESHLNFMVFDYLTAGKTAWNLILTEPRLYLFLLIWLLATTAFALCLCAIMTLTKRYTHRRSWTGQVVLFALFVLLAFVGIRGRVGLATIKWGVAYFSQNHFVNQLGLNPVYTLGRALTEEGSDPRLSYLEESDRFPFVPLDQALDSVQVRLGQGNDTWLNPDSSLLRQTAQPPNDFGFSPNIVIVLMESWSGQFTDCLGADLGLTPNFDRLAEQGILFTDFYANGTRSSYGMAATLCSFPALPGRSVMTRYNALHPFLSLSELLNERGYFNGFVHGGDMVFDNLEGFFTTKGYDRFWDETYFGEENVFAKWGIPDHVVFEHVTHLTDSLPRPFQLTIFTLSNHEPFDLPDSSVQIYQDDSEKSRVYNALRYADFALGNFIEQMREKPIFDSTIFVFTADHARWGRAPLAIHPINFHVPLLIYSPGLLGTDPRQIDKVCSQVDLLPTLMGLLGSDFTHASWGRDILNTTETDSGFAVLSVLERCAYVEKDFYYWEHIGHASQLLNRVELTDSIRNILYEQTLERNRLRQRLHLMGLPGSDFSHDGWGRNVLKVSDNDSGFAELSALERCAYVEKDFYYWGHIGHATQLPDSVELTDPLWDFSYEQPVPRDRLRRRLHLYLQAADQLSTPGSIQ